MTVDLNKLVAWFDNHKGKLTYSMTGSRNGADGTADCSGSVTQALKEAGANPAPAYLYSTVTLPAYLQSIGWQRVSVNQDWNAQRGDVILMSWGANMSASGGAGGHVGVMKDANTFISTDYWTGGAKGSAVSEHSWETYYNTNQPPYIEVWRQSQSPSTSSPSFAPSKKSDNDIANEVLQGKWGNNPERNQKLKAAGYNPDTIQVLVNQKLKTQPATGSHEYIVQSGDTLSAIGKKLGIDWKKLASDNGISDSNLIRPGQKIKY